MKTKMKLMDHFKNIPDPRKEHLIRHNLLDIIAIAICAIICGANTWNDIEAYGKSKENWLKKFLELPEGIPSHDTFSKVFSTIDPDQFKNSFLSWVNEISCLTKGEVVAIDGKTVRRAYEKDKNPLHVVNAWAGENNLVLGQKATEKKSNEITAIPKLLELLSINECIVTIDAMGCQKTIAEAIIEKKADYVLALKGNHEIIHEKVKQIFETNLDKINNYDFYKEIIDNRGRVETRKCTSIQLKDLEIDFPQFEEWTELKSIIRIESKRTIKNKESRETRYYISSLKTDAKDFNKIVRNHWKVENSLHWVLDVAFREDESRIRKGNSSENFSMMRQLALNFLKQEKTFKRGIQGKRLKAGWDNDYLLKILNI